MEGRKEGRERERMVNENSNGVNVKNRVLWTKGLFIFIIHL